MEHVSLAHRFKRLCSLVHAKETASGQFMGVCPSHEDKTASLSLSKTEGKILLHCFAGCQLKEILALLHLEERHLFEGTNTIPSLNGRPVSNSRPKTLQFNEVERYTYEQPDGTPQFVVVRKEATVSEGKRHKKFSQSGISSDGSLTWKMTGIKRLPYRLPKLKQAIEGRKPIIFLEGEKDVHSGEELGFVATTLPGGAKQTGGDSLATECSHWLKGADIILCPDNDETGIAWQQMLGVKFQKLAKRLRWLQLPELENKQDLTDWIAKGGTSEDLQTLIDHAPDFQIFQESTEEKPKISTLRSLSIGELLTLELPERKCLLNPWLPQQGLAMVYAPRGVGKSWFTWQVALSVATGTKFLNWEIPEPKRVLLLDGEMPAAVLQERFRQLVESLPEDPPEDLPLSILTPDFQEFGMPDLSSEEGQTKLEHLVKKGDLVIVDNISTLIRNGRENESDSWVPIQAWALRQRAQGKTILFVHHAGKTGDQRGSSKREDALDTVISLKRPENYSTEEGCRFEVHFTKTRGFYGADAEPLDLRLQTNLAGQLEWTAMTIKESTYEQVAGYLSEGFKQTEIANKLGISRQAVNKHYQRAMDSRKAVLSTRSFP